MVKKTIGPFREGEPPIRLPYRTAPPRPPARSGVILRWAMIFSSVIVTVLLIYAGVTNYCRFKQALGITTTYCKSKQQTGV